MFTLGERIKDRRQKLNLKQDELAELIGISRNVLSSYESNRNVPPGNMLGPIADALKVSVDYLLVRTDDPHQIFSQPEEVSQEKKLVMYRLRELLKEDLSEKDLESALEFFDFLESRNAKRKSKNDEK